MTIKRLYKSRSNTVLGGVCGGVGEYFDVDPTWVRLLWVILTLIGFWPVTIPGYILAWAIVPGAPPESCGGGSGPVLDSGTENR